MDYDRLVASAEGQVAFTLDGKSLTLQRGTHFFASAAERVQALGLLPEMMASLGLGDGDGEGGSAGN